MSSRPLWIAAPLVFGSGLCSLVYQMVWTRELRLVFGASTAATSAVVAIFVAGLCLGGLMLGTRAERSTEPLRMYARLELAIALLSALTPLLIDAARALYVWSGGSLRLGHAGSNVLRLPLPRVWGVPPPPRLGGAPPPPPPPPPERAGSGGGARGPVFSGQTPGAGG